MLYLNFSALYLNFSGLYLNFSGLYLNMSSGMGARNFLEFQ